MRLALFVLYAGHFCSMLCFFLVEMLDTTAVVPFLCLIYMIDITIAHYFLCWIDTTDTTTLTRSFL